MGTPECPPRCPRFVDKHGRALLVREHRSSDRNALREMYRIRYRPGRFRQLDCAEKRHEATETIRYR